MMFPVARARPPADTTAARALCDRCRPSAVRRQGALNATASGVQGSSSGRIRQQETLAAIRDVLADGDWRSTGDIAQRSTGISPPSTRSLVGLVSAGVLERQKRHPSTYPTEGDDVNEAGSTHRRQPKRDRCNRPMVPHAAAGSRSPFTRPATIADTLDDRHNLELWMRRQVLKGSIARPDLHALAATTDPDDKSALNKLCGQLRDAAAGVGRRANMGTAVRCDRSGKPWAGCPGDVR